MSMIVYMEDGRFDQEHFSLGLLMTHKHQYMPRTLYKVGRRAGEKFVTENSELAALLKDVPEYVTLRQRLDHFYESLPKPAPKRAEAL